MPRAQPYTLENLIQLRRLVNEHLGAVLPGWALTERALGRHLERDDWQYVVDP